MHARLCINKASLRPPLAVLHRDIFDAQNMYRSRAAIPYAKTPANHKYSVASS
ncbi:hypothetical protein ACRALDRAFT_210570 [Sodiomyces alcalophilus JCM 7366]|uniref:uncharacterized protein n=1 Tax=Sodiomyces alcalophilus JCM 7366 TaxID=591952 RepID=UPI0039B68C85